MKPVQQQELYLDLPTLELLDQFGKGSHIPGSGSAAALSGMIAIELLKTVCILTQTKDRYQSVHSEMAYIQKVLVEDYKPKLIELFYSDSREFGKVSQLRMERDAEPDLKVKEKLGREAAEQLRLATEIPIDTCKTCIKLIEYAFAIFDKGFQATRGDAGVAISNLLAAVSGSLFIILLNVKVAKESSWTKSKRKEAEGLAAQYVQLQKDAFSRVVNLYQASASGEQTALPFETNEALPKVDLSAIIDIKTSKS